MNEMIDKHNLIVTSPTCPGEGYVKITPELAKKWLELIDSIEEDIKDIDKMLKERRKLIEHRKTL